MLGPIQQVELTADHDRFGVEGGQAIVRRSQTCFTQLDCEKGDNVSVILIIIVQYPHRVNIN